MMVSLGRTDLSSISGLTSDFLNPKYRTRWGSRLNLLGAGGLEDSWWIANAPFRSELPLLGSSLQLHVEEPLVNLNA